jgi:SAM-dependent methyltransferase
MQPAGAPSDSRSAEIERLLARYPKTRSVLPPAITAIYAAQYKENRSGESAAASLAQRLERWMHRRVAEDVADGSAVATLELGAGTLNQLPFEPASAPYDIVEPFTALFEDSPRRGRIRDVFRDISEAPLDRRYARITSVAALEHVGDLPFVLARAAGLLAPAGVLRAAIPAEGGLLWRIGWMATTGLEFRLRHGLDYGILMRHEHLNTAVEIESLVRLLFAQVRVRSLGLGRQLSLYRFIEARDPRLEIARAWEQRFAAPSA